MFVGKEALPLLTSSEVHHEVTFGGLFAPTHQGGESLYVWQPVSEVPKYNVLPLVVGSLKITLVSLFFAVPLSVGAAIFVSEYAGPRLREMVKPAIELLAGVPSVVIGFFALIVWRPGCRARSAPSTASTRWSPASGCRSPSAPSCSRSRRTRCGRSPGRTARPRIAMGSTRAQAILRVVLPAAAPGIAASVVLGFGRAIGETMIVVIASGNAALLDASLGRSARTITATIAQELGEVVIGSAHYDVLFALGAMLFLATFVVNFAGERIVHGMRRKLGIVA